VGAEAAVMARIIRPFSFPVTLFFALQLFRHVLFLDHLRV
jgi:hypothetical protein